ncbi:Tetratricopeptide repeat protein [Hyella patelloides LEGE 07179]|uniref:Tetratricopeptide repeat protein n=1 Tax=Hyella patelloides LEGE 07179 TaxID=945734 RepID=A0A563VVV5_9CYAN|nr:tetratricopeptide repeat protein [Hyella patelloides]VEP15594.1 Tetratricopeptide repeat protein [Hyella patelloides LEGE 07179]
MNKNLPIIYISTLLIILIIAAVAIVKEVIKTRFTENTFSKLQKKLKNSPGTAEEYYQLGSIYLDKKLFVQSIKLFEKALKSERKLPPENTALIHNAMGYAYFAQEQYDIAIRKYKEALKIYPEYVVALNNLGNVYEKKQLIAQAVEAYENVLKYEPENKVAKRRAESLKKRLVSSDK